MNWIEFYAIEPEYFAKLRAISERLQGGTDRERDEGHRLMLVLDAAEKIIFGDRKIL